MSSWTIANATGTTVDAELTPAFVIKIDGKTYVTVLVKELTGLPEDVVAFYENGFINAQQALAPAGVAYEINTADEKMQGSINVVNINR